MLVSSTDLLLKYEKSAIAILPEIAECLEIVQDPKGLSAIIWILGEYGEVQSDVEVIDLNFTLRYLEVNNK